MPVLSTIQLNQLTEIAIAIRQSVVKMLSEAGSGHSAGSLGMADVFTALYFHELKHRPKQPHWNQRDYVLLSNGHICPVWYATLAEAGYFPKSELLTLRKINSRLQGHPHLFSLPGIENTSGPLGQGISQAVGLAKGLKMDGKKNRVYCGMSDAEFQEGQTWEALQFAAKYQLDNLTVLVDRNTIQIEGSTETVMPLEPLDSKLTAFGCFVQKVNGHDFEAIINAFCQVKSHTGQPAVLLCTTIPGKDVSFMEGDYRWHGLPPDKHQAKKALQQLRTLKGQIWAE